MTPLRICLDARLTPGEMGGVEQVVLGTAAGLSALTDGDEEYIFLTLNDSEWLRPYIGGNCRIHEITSKPVSLSLKQSLRQKFPVLQRAWHYLSPLLGKRSVPFTNGDLLIQDINADLVHFVIQTGFLTSIPSIFSPFDLQHLHLPAYFTRREIYARELLYRTFCNQAELVIAASEWGKTDLVHHYNLPPNKVQVVPVGNILSYYPQPTDSDLRAVREKFTLPERFLFFPAQTYPSKNHIGLLEALARLRDNGVEIPLVCSGRTSAFFPEIEKVMTALGLGQQVKFVGYITTLELQSLYRLSAGLVFPTKFEGWGQPIIEAFYSGIPVACSNVTSLPEVAGDAVLFFDPNSVSSIAEQILILWQDQAVRERLISRGHARAQLFTWERTAKIFRAIYRKIAGVELTEADRRLLSEPAIP